MAYDEALADRVRDLLADRGELREQKMFGGLCWMLNGNMACGVLGEDLIVRVGAEAGDAALSDPNARPFDFSGRPMKGSVYVAPSGTESNEDLASWVDAGAGYALSLPAK
jgi:TfoX/Sxy family transcriptional regulator of competence genes